MGLVGRIPLDSKLYADENQTWVSENGTFTFGFAESGDGFHLAIWYAELPGVRTTVWSANRDVAVEKGAVVRFKPDGDLVLEDQDRPVWCSNTSRYGATTAAMLESGELVIFSGDGQVAWQSSWHPTDTLLPGQPLKASLELASPRTPLGYYSLKMLQQASSHEDTKQQRRVMFDPWDQHFMAAKQL